MTETSRTQKKTKNKKKNKNILKRVSLIALGIILAICFFGAGVLKSIIEGAPPLDLRKISEQSETTFFYDQDGKPITDYYGFENRIWADLDEIPEMLQNAFIAIEDKRFKEHKGMDYVRMVGAFVNNLKGGHIQGASTITQQLVKTLYLTPERSYTRKIQEAYLATKLEKEFSKEEILEAYLNTVNFEEGNYGVKAASKDYFGKEDMNELTIKEIATLAGLVRNPASYNPRRNYHRETDRKHITEERTQVVLKAMLDNGFINQDEYETAKNEELHVIEEAGRLKLYDMAPFIEYAIYEVRDAIIKNKGWKDDKEGRQKADEYIYTSGLKVYTTLDRKVQKTVEETLYNWDKYPKMPEEDDNPLPQPQAAAVVMDNSGEIKAIVGGRTPPTNKRELNRADTPVMVGSTIKPIAVYGPALEEGKSPGTIYHNIPVKIAGWDSKRDFPKNYGGGGYSGPTTMRTGLVKSLNVVAAQTLIYDVGVETSKTYLEGLGIDPSHIEANGSGLALGTSSITPIELAGAYSAVANGGIFNEPISVLKVVDRDGKVIIDRTANKQQQRIFSEATSWMLIDMMKDAVRNGTGKNAQIPGMTVAGKTGTNTEFKGVAFAGFTPYYTGVVWIGHDEGKSLGSNVQGGKDAAPLWQTFMARIHEEAGLEDRDILSNGPEALGLVKKRICRISGKLAGANCPDNAVIADWFHPGAVPGKVCDQHGTIQVCRDSGKLPGPYCPEESIENKFVYFLESSSPYWQLSRDQIAKWIPGAYFGFSNMGEAGSLDFENPEHRGYFCDIHNEPLEPEEDEEDDDLDDLEDFFNGLMPDKDKPGEEDNRDNDKHESEDKDKNKDNDKDQGQDNNSGKDKGKGKDKDKDKDIDQGNKDEQPKNPEDED